MKEEKDIQKKEDYEKDLTDWENPPSLIDLKSDFEQAKSSHDSHVANVERWMRNFNGEQVIKSKKGRSKIVPKLIRKQAEWRYPSLSEPFLSTEELFDTSPRTFEDREAARQNGLVLNYQFNHKIGKVSFIDEYVRTVVDEGTVIVKIGWEEEEGEKEVEYPIFENQVIQDPQVYQQVVAQGVAPIQQVQVGVEVKTETVSIVNQPTVEICNYDNVVLDPTCEGDIDKAEFIVYSFEASKSGLEKDGRYFNLDEIVFDTSSVLASPDYQDQDDTEFEFKDEPRKKFVVNEYWGFWDIHDDGTVVPILAAWAGDTLIRLEENPYPDQKLPFVKVQYLPVRKSNYGEPDGELLEDNQKIIGAVTRGMIDIIGRSANGQQGVRKDALDVVNSRKFERGDDYKFNATVDPKAAFYMGTYPEIPQSAVTMLTYQNNEAESLTGVKAFSTGITGKALGDSVGGIRSALDATSKRELGILRRLAEGMKEIGRKVISMNQEFLSDEEIIRVTNEEFVTINREDLGGEFDVILSISTPEADTEKAQELSFVLQTMGNNQDPEVTKMIQVQIARLRNMPDLAKQIEEYQPQPDPLAVKKAELEIALLEAQVFNEQSKGKENAVDVELKTAKTDTERAKARSLESKADNDDLAFIEQESGTNHERERDLKSLDQQNQNEGKLVDKMIADDQGQEGLA